MQINENTLEQAIIVDLEGKGYEYLYGPDIERDYHDVILKTYYEMAIAKINKGITASIIEESYKTIMNLGLLKLEELNASFHKYLIEGIPVPYRDNSENKTYTVKLVDFDNPEENDFKVVNQYTIIDYKQKRPDILVFINGIPMILFELKNAANEDTTITNAYNQIQNYMLDIPKLFWYNAFNVISDGLNTKVGTITSDFTRYMAWKSENGERPDEGSIDFYTTMLNGMFPKERLLDIIRNFIVYQSINGKTVKILAGYHQYFAVKKAVERTYKAIEEKSNKVGVVWHTQGSGKSLSMVFYTGLIVSNPEFKNPTIVVLTDRNDLDNQLFGTFCASSKLLLRQTPKHAESRAHLKELLSVNAGGIIFTTIQKFEESDEIISDRSNIIFMADEAHRSQYGLEEKLDTEIRDLALIDMLASTGMRIGELVRLNREDVDFNERECVVFGKGDKERIVYFDARTKLHLQEYLNTRKDNDKALFVGLRKPYRRVTINGIELRIRQIGREVGIKKCHPHKFRRTMATVAIDKGMPLEQLQKLLGHEKIDTTLHYAMVKQSNVKNAHRKYIG